ncbi:MAG: hypothetical protein MKZ53_00420 [Candidatus Thalassarchaeum sp.]|nr:hypothetical protein [Candidatus Thalassarchaeum sp.]
MAVVNSLQKISSLTVMLLILTMSSMGYFMLEQETAEKQELQAKEMPRFAVSPGHTVFGEYVGAHWCGPCMGSASPSLVNLKNSNTEDFTYISFFEGASTGWPSDGPVNRQNHIMASSSGYPTYAFADENSGSCYKVGSAGSNYYDADFSAGGCMHADASDFSMELGIALDSTGDIVTTTLDITYLGANDITVYVYGAVTEKIGAEAYDDGSRPHHVFREWLLSADNDFTEVTLIPNQVETLTWDKPLNTVRSGGGNTQWENFWPVFALMDGDYSTYNEVYAAIDLDMGPLIDIGIVDFETRNSNANNGFVAGDILDLDVNIANNGAEAYSDGGSIDIYHLSGGEEIHLGGISINQLAVGGTQSYSIMFDTSEITLTPSGTSSFRARISGIVGDRVPSNDYQDGIALHDMPPVPNRPVAVAESSVERGTPIQFESSALPNDLVDDMSTMTADLHYSVHGTDTWEDAWITAIDMVGSGGNSRYIHTITPPMNSQSGSYDIRMQWTDSGGQKSDWEITENAFELRNALPRILGPGDDGYGGIPTVKVDTVEAVSIVGLISDAETPHGELIIDSNAHQFVSFDSETLEINVLFDQISYDSIGNSISQGIFITVGDGEDINSGTLMFNVIENGQPRWSGIPTQSFNEGGSSSLVLTEYVSDTDDNGNSVPANTLSLSVVSISDESLLSAEIYDQTLNVAALDDDSFGMAEITVRASDGVKESDTVIIFYVNNINDAPIIDLGEYSNPILQSGDRLTFNVIDLISDVDDSEEDIWITVTTFVPGAVQFNPISGLATMSWEDAGEEMVTVTAEDRHGASSAAIITVSVVDDLPLLWVDSSGFGDLSVNISSTEYGLNPSVTIENVGNLELSEIKVIWSVCNSITGICNDFGTSHNMGPFIVLANDGEGLKIADYVTLSVDAVDSEGFDRSTTDQYKAYATEPVEITPDEPENSDNQDKPVISVMTAGLIAMGIMLSIALVLALAIVLQRGRRDGVNVEEYDYQDEYDYSEYEEPEPSPLVVPPPPPGMGPPLPPEGLPPGWTMEQWNYYGAEYLKRRELQ